MPASKHYVVWVGREPGIYTTWDQCRAQVNGYAGAKYQAFKSRDEAEQAFIHRSGPAPKSKTQTKQDPGKPKSTRKKKPAAPLPARQLHLPSRSRTPHADLLADGYTVLYTDGGCEGNPGPGGYGVVKLRQGEPRQEWSAGYTMTTNNRMELLGWITALEHTTLDDKIALLSDSQYVGRNWAMGYAEGWRKRGWKRSDKGPVANVDLWERLLNLLDPRDVVFGWIKGHAGVPENERCDQLAGAAARTLIDEGYKA